MSQAKPVEQESASQQRVVLLATDRSQSILGEIVDGQTHTIAYSAYGEQSAQQKVETRLGFNGQVREADIGWYLLGNGYRAYNPRLMRFHSPDSWSPFGQGGLNAYMYCVGDPVNRSDPTGHWGALALFSSARELGIIGYLTSSVGTGLNIGSLVINRGRATLIEALGAVSGLTGMAAGLSTMFDMAPQVSQMLSATSLVSGATSTYLGYRAMRANFRHLGWYEAPFSRPGGGSPPDYFDLYPNPRASIDMPSPPPVYPLNRSTMLPPTTGHRSPAYSQHHPDLFLSPLSEADTHSTFSKQIQIEGTSALSNVNRQRRRSLDRMDGLTTSTTIRRR
jgi:RHS repeat-associated protein